MVRPQETVAQQADPIAELRRGPLAGHGAQALIANAIGAQAGSGRRWLG